MNKLPHSEEEAAQLHQLYYTLAHRILPDLILVTNDVPADDAYPDSMLQDASGRESTYTGSSEALHLLNTFYGSQDTADDAFEVSFPDDFFEEEEDLVTDAPEEFFGEEDDAGFLQGIRQKEDEEAPELAELMAALEAELGLHDAATDNTTPEEDFLDDTWRMAWYQTDLEEMPARDGYTIENRVVNGTAITLFSFPAPFQIPDAWMAAAVHRFGRPSRYFTLEKTLGGDESTERAVLAEWRSVGTHINCGRYLTEVTNKEVFLKVVLEYMAA